MFLYIPPELGTYAGNVDTFPNTQQCAAGISWRVESVGGRAGCPDGAATAWAQASGAGRAAAAGADVSLHAKCWHLGRAFLPALRRLAGRQFVGRPARAL